MRWLDKRGIIYSTVDVSQSPDDLAAVKALGFQESPVVIVSTGDAELDLMWSGFDPNNLSKYATRDKAA